MHPNQSMSTSDATRDVDQSSDVEQSMIADRSSGTEQSMVVDRSSGTEQPTVAEKGMKFAKNLHNFSK